MLKLQPEGNGQSQLHDETDSVLVFKNLVFKLRILNWDGQEFLSLTEKDVSIDRLNQKFRYQISQFNRGELKSVRSFESKTSWAEIQLKVGDSKVHTVDATQPIRTLKEEVRFFLGEVFPFES